jgi:hypothetical protein
MEAFFSSDDYRINRDLIRQRAESVVKQNIEAFRQNIAATVEYELLMMKRQAEDGNQIAAENCKILAEIYQSILDRI